MLGKESNRLQELKEECKKKRDEIKAKLNGRQISGIKDEERSEFCKLYLNVAQLAKEIVANEKNEQEITRYTELQNLCNDRAKALGSVMKAEIPDTTFDDIKGLEPVKKLTKSFIFMAKNAKLLKAYKMEGGLGILMYGAPGTGKTMFAQAIANEMKLPLFIITPADIFKSYVGASEQAVRDIFNQIEACPDGAILFIDECESIFSTRTSDTKDYKAAVTTELLQRLNGFGVDGSKRVLIGATNRPDLIDSAFLRYKRFTHQIHITPPDREAKRAIIEGKLKGIALEPGLTYDSILEMTEKPRIKMTNLGPVPEPPAYFSAADLSGAIEEACRLAIEQIQAAGGSEPIPLTVQMFEKAFEKVAPSISQEVLDQYSNFRRTADSPTK